MRWLSLALLLACAPKRVEPAQPEPAPRVVATNLIVPDAGPFDFSKVPAEEQPPPVSGDMAHPNHVPGYPRPLGVR